MSSTFSSYTYNFGTLLGRSSFPSHTAKEVIVPQFQRGFSWEKQHVATFWDDVWDFHAKSDPKDTYFLGPIVILPKSDRIVLLDGQQRLATATMLLASLRDVAREFGGQNGTDLARDLQRDYIWVDEDEQTYALTMNKLDQPYFEANTQGDPPTNDVPASVRSHRLLRNAAALLRANIVASFDTQVPATLVGQLKRFGKTVVEKLKLVVIEVESDGEAYQIFETLNDRGLRLSVPDLLLNFLMQNAGTDSARTRVRQHWDAIVETTGPRRISVFLRHMWVSKYGDVKSQSLFREIKNRVSAKSVSSSQFAKDAAQECESYAGIVERSGLPNAAEPHVEAIVKHLSAEKAYPLLLSSRLCLSDSDFATVARVTVAIIARHSVIANLNPSDLEDVLYDTALQIRREHAKGTSGQSIVGLVRSRFQKINPDRASIERGLEELYLKKIQAQYILREIANSMQSKTKAIQMGKTSIEHVFPQNAEITEWPDKDKLVPYLWHIGNLTLYEPKKNSELGNKAYQNKKSQYEASEITMTNGLGKTFPAWGVKTIQDRAKSFAKAIDAVWQL